MSFSRVIEIKDPMGLHSRPAGQIVMLARELGFVVLVGLAGQAKVSAVSPLALMALKAKVGTKLEFEIEALDESQADEVALKLKEILGG